MINLYVVMYERQIWRQRSISIIPVFISVGACWGDMSVSVADDASSVMTAATCSSDKRTDLADSNSDSGIVVLWVELDSVSLTTANSGFGTVPD